VPSQNVMDALCIFMLPLHQGRIRDDHSGISILHINEKDKV